MSGEAGTSCLVLTYKAQNLTLGMHCCPFLYTSCLFLHTTAYKRVEIIRAKPPEATTIPDKLKHFQHLLILIACQAMSNYMVKLWDYANLCVVELLITVTFVLVPKVDKYHLTFGNPILLDLSYFPQYLILQSFNLSFPIPCAFYPFTFFNPFHALYIFISSSIFFNL